MSTCAQHYRLSIQNLNKNNHMNIFKLKTGEMVEEDWLLDFTLFYRMVL